MYIFSLSSLHMYIHIIPVSHFLADNVYTQINRSFIINLPFHRACAMGTDVRLGWSWKWQTIVMVGKYPSGKIRLQPKQWKHSQRLNNPSSGMGITVSDIILFYFQEQYSVNTCFPGDSTTIETFIFFYFFFQLEVQRLNYCENKRQIPRHWP